MDQATIKAFIIALSAEKPHQTWAAEKYFQWEADTRAIATALLVLNDHFDRELFLRECGIEAVA